MHWSLFSVLESDLAKVSRYIEFDERNYDTFSTELSKLLLSSCSEIDVVFKQLCLLVDPGASRKNIVDYFSVIDGNQELRKIFGEEIFIPRFGLSIVPFNGWDADTRPKWWKSYNSVKHNRQHHFSEASLGNVLNATCALMLCVFYLEKLSSPGKEIKEITSEFQPNTQLLRLQDGYYYSTVFV